MIDVGHLCSHEGKNDLIGLDALSVLFSNPLYKRIETDDDDVTSKIQRPSNRCEGQCSLIIIISADRKQIDDYAGVVAVIKPYVMNQVRLGDVNNRQKKKRMKRFE